MHERVPEEISAAPLEPCSMRTKTTHFIFRVLLALAVFAPLSASAVERSVWRIGSFDNSAAEFRSEGIDYSDPKQDIIFKIGESKANEWPPNYSSESAIAES